jgi:broad specificity phosphatase PhoE
MPAELRLLLVRHGLTDWNESGRLLGRTPIGLNDRGREQARALGRALVTLPVAAVATSPQRRTHETAESIATALGLAVDVADALDEVWLGTRWQGKTFPEIAGDADLARYMTDPLFPCDAIEPTAAVERRVVDLVEGLRQKRRGQTLALVSHGDPLRVLIAHYLGIPLGMFRRLTVSPGSVSVLRFGSRGVRLLVLNWRPGDGSLGELLESGPAP